MLGLSNDVTCVFRRRNLSTTKRGNSANTEPDFQYKVHKVNIDELERILSYSAHPCNVPCSKTPNCSIGCVQTAISSAKKRFKSSRDLHLHFSYDDWMYFKKALHGNLKTLLDSPKAARSIRRVMAYFHTSSSVFRQFFMYTNLKNSEGMRYLFAVWHLSISVYKDKIPLYKLDAVGSDEIELYETLRTYYRAMIESGMQSLILHISEYLGMSLFNVHEMGIANTLPTPPPGVVLAGRDLWTVLYRCYDPSTASFDLTRAVNSSTIPVMYISYEASRDNPESASNLRLEALPLSPVGGDIHGQPLRVSVFDPHSDSSERWTYLESLNRYEYSDTSIKYTNKADLQDSTEHDMPGRSGPGKTVSTAPPTSAFVDSSCANVNANTSDTSNAHGVASLGSRDTSSLRASSKTQEVPYTTLIDDVVYRSCFYVNINPAKVHYNNTPLLYREQLLSSHIISRISYRSTDTQTTRIIEKLDWINEFIGKWQAESRFCHLEQQQLISLASLSINKVDRCVLTHRGLYVAPELHMLLLEKATLFTSDNVDKGGKPQSQSSSSVKDEAVASLASLRKELNKMDIEMVESMHLMAEIQLRRQSTIPSASREIGESTASKTIGRLENRDVKKKDDRHNEGIGIYRTIEMLPSEERLFLSDVNVERFKRVCSLILDVSNVQKTTSISYATLISPLLVVVRHARVVDVEKSDIHSNGASCAHVKVAVHGIEALNLTQIELMMCQLVQSTFHLPTMRLQHSITEIATDGQCYATIPSHICIRENIEITEDNDTEEPHESYLGTNPGIYNRVDKSKRDGFRKLRFPKVGEHVSFVLTIHGFDNRSNWNIFGVNIDPLYLTSYASFSIKSE